MTRRRRDSPTSPRRSAPRKLHLTARAETGALDVREIGLSDDEQARITSALSATRSPATQRVYRSAWNTWQRWAEERGFPVFPARAEHVATYYIARADAGVSLATLELAHSALHAIHDERGGSDPTRSRVVSATLSGLRRALGKSAHQAAGLTQEALDAVVEAAPASLVGNFDVALCRTMRDAMLRVAEAAALTWSDIERSGRGTGRLLIRRSKTDQLGSGSVQFLSMATMRSLNTIRPENASGTDYVFTLRGRRAPHPSTLSTRIRDAALRAGLGDGFSGHSPRVGMARDLAASGVELPALMVAGRWQSPGMPALYARREEAERNAVARYYRERNETTGAERANGEHD